MWMLCRLQCVIEDVVSTMMRDLAGLNKVDRKTVWNVQMLWRKKWEDFKMVWMYEATLRMKFMMTPKLWT